MQLEFDETRPQKKSCFSIHKRIEGGATTRKPKKLKSPKQVSVSTSGSKGVQRRQEVINRLGGCSFSIHKRIEGGATLSEIVGKPISLTFQYPQADRRGCNPRLLQNSSTNQSVSVSTSGSKGVQQNSHKRRIENETAFQYPQADRRGCNELSCGDTIDFRKSFSIHKRIEGGATRC